MRKKELPDWSKKVDQPLLELAELYKEHVRLSERLKRLPLSRWKEVLGEEPDEETKKRAADGLNQLVPPTPQTEQEIGREAFFALTISAMEKKPIQVAGVAISYNGLPNENPANLWLLAMMEFLAKQRFGRPLYQLVAEDRAGVKDSSEKVHRIMQDAHKLRYGDPVKPTKGKIDHRLMFDFGLGRGLENLTAEELAHFFDEFCPFCAGEHDPDALRRQRDSLKKQRQKAIDWNPVGFDPAGK